MNNYDYYAFYIKKNGNVLITLVFEEDFNPHEVI